MPFVGQQAEDRTQLPLTQTEQPQHDIKNIPRQKPEHEGGIQQHKRCSPGSQTAQEPSHIALGLQKVTAECTTETETEDAAKETETGDTGTQMTLHEKVQQRHQKSIAESVTETETEESATESEMGDTGTQMTMHEQLQQQALHEANMPRREQQHQGMAQTCQTFQQKPITQAKSPVEQKPLETMHGLAA